MLKMWKSLHHVEFISITLHGWINIPCGMISQCNGWLVVHISTYFDHVDATFKVICNNIWAFKAFYRKSSQIFFFKSPTFSKSLSYYWPPVCISTYHVGWLTTKSHVGQSFCDFGNDQQCISLSKQRKIDDAYVCNTSAIINPLCWKAIA